MEFTCDKAKARTLDTTFFTNPHEMDGGSSTERRVILLTETLSNDKSSFGDRFSHLVF